MNVSSCSSVMLIVQHGDVQVFTLSYFMACLRDSPFCCSWHAEDHCTMVWGFFHSHGMYSVISLYKWASVSSTGGLEVFPDPETVKK